MENGSSLGLMLSSAKGYSLLEQQKSMVSAYLRLDSQQPLPVWTYGVMKHTYDQP